MKKNVLIILFFVCCFLCLQCSTAHKAINQKIIAIQFNSNFPFIDSMNGKFILTNFRDNDNIIISYNGYTVCRFKKTNISSNIKSDYQEKKNIQYFIFKKINRIGYLYDSSMKQNIGRDSVYPILRKTYFFEGHFEVVKNDTLIYANKEKNGYFIAKYVPKVKYDISFPDTSIYCFSNTFQDGGYPLSVYMDSLWKSNLVSVRFVYNQSRYNLTGATIPYREFAVEKKEIKLENENEIIEFVERFAKEHKE